MQDFETIGSWQFQKNKPVFWRIIRQVFSKTFPSQDAGDSSPFSAGTWRVPDTNLTQIKGHNMMNQSHPRSNEDGQITISNKKRKVLQLDLKTRETFWCLHLRMLMCKWIGFPNLQTVKCLQSKSHCDYKLTEAVNKNWDLNRPFLSIYPGCTSNEAPKQFIRILHMLNDKMDVIFLPTSRSLRVLVQLCVFFSLINRKLH